MELKELLEKLQTAFEEFKRTNDERIQKIEKGQGTADLDEKLVKINADLDKFSELKERVEELEASASAPGAPGTQKEQAKALAMKAFRGFLAGDMEARAQVLEIAEKEGLDVKAINIGTGSDGGVAVPEVISQDIMQEVVDISPIRQIARVVPVGTSDYKELVDTRGTSSGWVGETAARGETNTPSLEEVAPPMGEVYANPRATQWALDDIFFDVEGWLREGVGTEFARQEGAAFITGDGTNKPLGFLSGTPVTTGDDARAFGVLQYLASGAAANITDPDKLVELTYLIKAAYRQRARWCMNRTTLGVVRLLKDGDSNYIWQPGLERGQPNQLLGYPVTEAEDMPVIAANAFPIAFGDFQRGYVIVDRVGVRMLRDPYTAKPYVQFYTTKRVGGRIKDDNALKLLKCEV